MKKRVFRLSALLCLVLLTVSVFSVSAFAAGEGEEVGLLEKWVGPVHDAVNKAVPDVVRYIDGVPAAICTLFETAAPAAWVTYAVFLGVLVVLAVVLVLLIVSIFKHRFFRALAGTVIAAVVIWLASFAVYVAGNGKIFSDLDLLHLIHSTMREMMPNLYGLVDGLTDPLWLIPAIFLAASVLVIVLMSIVIVCSKKRAKRRKAAAAAFLESEPELISAPKPVEESAAEAPAAEAAEEKPAEEASAPAEEETAAEAPAEEVTAEEAPAEEATEEEAPAEEEPAAEEGPAYPTLPQPIFMPVPSAVFDTVDFTEPSRDGFTLCVSATADEAASLMSDAHAEDLTAIVYRSESGSVAEVGLDCLSANFKPYAYVDAKILRRLGLIAADARRLSVVASGVIDKPLMIEASEFSTEAVKMITLAGGRAIRVL